MYVIAYDVGTTGLKSCLFSIGKDQPIELIAGETADYDLYVLDNGGIEQDPIQWWDAMGVTTKKLLEKTGIPKEDIKGMAKHAAKEANPLYPVPKLMSAKQLEQFYYDVMEEN